MPTNAKILVVYNGDWQSLGEATMKDVKLRVARGAEVSTTRVFSFAPQTDRIALVEIVPDAPLLEETDYEVLTRIQDVPCGGTDEPACVGEARVWGHFTTGDGPDTVKPVMTGEATASIELPNLFNLEWPDATDDSDEIMYDVYVDGYKLCEGSLRGGRFEIRAIDAAGNLSNNAAAITLDPPCPKLPSRDDTGCGVAGGVRGSGGLLPCLAILIARAVRHRGQSI